MSRKIIACSDTMVKMTPQNSVEDRMKVQRSKSIRHTPINAPETLRALTDKCGTVRGQIKAPVMEKCFRPMATDRMTAKVNQATGNRQQATGNRQQLYTSSK